MVPSVPSTVFQSEAIWLSNPDRVWLMASRDCPRIRSRCPSSSACTVPDTPSMRGIIRSAFIRSSPSSMSRSRSISSG